MKVLLPLRGMFIIVLLFATVMLLSWALVQWDFDRYLIPTPEVTVEQFFDALNSHDFQAARDELSERLQQDVEPDDLKALEQKIERAHQGIVATHAQNLEPQPSSTMTTVNLEFQSGAQRSFTLPLEKEQGLWKMTSIEPLVQAFP